MSDSQGSDLPRIKDYALAFPYGARVIWFVLQRDRLDRLEVCIEQSTLEALPDSQASVNERVTNDQVEYAKRYTLAIEYSHEEHAMITANGEHVE
jgi:hypothetical protein